MNEKFTARAFSWNRHSWSWLVASQLRITGVKKYENEKWQPLAFLIHEISRNVHSLLPYWGWDLGPGVSIDRLSFGRRVLGQLIGIFFCDFSSGTNVLDGSAKKRDLYPASPIFRGKRKGAGVVKRTVSVWGKVEKWIQDSRKKIWNWLPLRFRQTIFLALASVPVPALLRNGQLRGSMLQPRVLYRDYNWLWGN